MARKCRDQLTFLTAIGQPEDKWREEDYLAKPFSREEQRDAGKLYVENIGLIKFFANKLCRKYSYCMAPEDVDSCVDIAFLKVCRAHDSSKGALSTIFWRFAEGEILHYLRSHNWSVKAPHKVRELGNRARKLLDQGLAPEVVCHELQCSRDELKDALLATAGVAHEVKGFDLHISPYPSPMELLEAEELVTA